MNPKSYAFIFTGMLLARCVLPAVAQGTFQNLDFESPVLPLMPDSSSRVASAAALPGWTVWVGNNQANSVFYNTVSLGAAAASFHSTASPFAPVQGNFSLILQPSSAGPQTAVAVSQVGQIPGFASSVLFYGSDGMEVFFAGQQLTLANVGNGSGYSVLSADVSSYAGQTGELRFLMPNQLFPSMTYLDNIQFVPEPSTFGLFGLGSLGLLLYARLPRKER